MKRSSIQMKKKLTNLLKFVIFLGVGVGILYLVYQNQNAAYQEDCQLKGVSAADCQLIDKVIDDFTKVNYFWVIMILVAFLISNVSRAIRWKMLLKPLGYRPRFVNAFFSIILAYFANLGLPRVGEIVRAGSLAKYEKIPAEKVMGTIVTDRIIDVISILIVTFLALFFAKDVIWTFFKENASIGSKIDSMRVLVLYLLGLFIFIAALFFTFKKQITQSKIYKKILHIIIGFGEGIKSILQLDKPWLFVLHSINIWTMYFLMTYFGFLTFGPTAGLPMVAALVVFVFGSWGIVIPSPGGMGTYHFLVGLALGIYGVNQADGFSWANIVFFSIQLGCNILIGILALLALPIINANYEPPQKIKIKS